MPTVDLTTSPTGTVGLLEGLARRVTLTLSELRLVAERAGGAPLPFDLVEPAEANALDGRLGQSRSSAEDAAYTAALGGLHDPATSLTRRGLLDDVEGRGLAGAVGLLATPTTAVDIDVAAGGIRARAWHRRSGEAVATLSTVDGIVFELAWFEAGLWPSELARVALLPEDLPVQASEVPAHADLPFELADAAAEAIRAGRADLVPVLVAQHSGSMLDATGSALPDVDATRLLTSLTQESRGRLRAMVADLAGGAVTVVGVVSWTLLGDGWHALRPRFSDGAQRVVIGRVEPEDLAGELAPVLAEVTG